MKIELEVRFEGRKKFFYDKKSGIMFNLLEAVDFGDSLLTIQRGNILFPFIFIDYECIQFSPPSFFGVGLEKSVGIEVAPHLNPSCFIAGDKLIIKIGFKGFDLEERIKSNLLIRKAACSLPSDKPISINKYNKVMSIEVAKIIECFGGEETFRKKKILDFD